MTKTKLVLCAVALLGIGFVLGVLGTKQTQSVPVGGTVYDASNLVGDVYQGLTHSKVFTGGNMVGNILQLTLGQLAVLGDVVIAPNGYTQTLATSTTLTPAQFCLTVHQHWLGTNAVATGTLPAATSTYIACGSPAFGAIQPFNYTTNDSTNTVNIVAGTGMTFRCPTTGVGTTTIVGGCTSSQFSLTTSTSINAWGYWSASGTMIINLNAMDK